MAEGNKGAVTASTNDFKELLRTRESDYLVNRNGDQVPLSELDGKVVGILFYLFNHACDMFAQVLSEAYEELKQRGEPFEVVIVSLENDRRLAPEATVWPFSLQFKDKSKRLYNYFDIRRIPSLVIVGQDGKTVHRNAVELVEGLGAASYPFTPKKEKYLEEVYRRKFENQTLETVLVHGELDYVVDNSYVVNNVHCKVPVGYLVGKTVLIYFGTQRSSPGFTPRMREVYRELKRQRKKMEVVFVSSDEDEADFRDYFGSMPWLALPFWDPRKKSLWKMFQVEDVPTLVVLDRSGKTVTVHAKEMVIEHGAAAFPFTEARIKKVDALADATAAGWPETLKIEKHELMLEKSKKGAYRCAMCYADGKGWVFSCDEYRYNAHPKCALDMAATEHAAKVRKEAGENVVKAVVAANGEEPRWYRPVVHGDYHGWELDVKAADEDVVNITKKVGESTVENATMVCKKVGENALETVAAKDATKVNKNVKKNVVKERIKEIDALADVASAKWPERLKIKKHKHELEKSKKGPYKCDMCNMGGKGWGFFCDKCNYKAHHECAIDAEKYFDYDAWLHDIQAAKQVRKKLPEGIVTEDASNGSKTVGENCSVKDVAKACKVGENGVDTVVAKDGAKVSEKAREDTMEENAAKGVAKISQIDGENVALKAVVKDVADVCKEARENVVVAVTAKDVANVSNEAGEVSMVVGVVKDTTKVSNKTQADAPTTGKEPRGLTRVWQSVLDLFFKKLQ